jgi:hypothetical protein
VNNIQPDNDRYSTKKGRSISLEVVDKKKVFATTQITNLVFLEAP